MTGKTNLQKKLVAIIMAFALTLGSLGLFTLTAKAAEVDVWDGTVATAFAGGDGSEDNPYQIATSAQFAYFAKCIEGEDSDNYSDKHYVLNSDLDLSSQNWTPISMNAYEDSCFKGDFDGKGHTITYKFEKSQATQRFEGYGLFGSSEGVISNLTVAGTLTIDCYIEYSWGGGLVGIKEGNIINCTSKVNIVIKNNAEFNSVWFGGITGNIQKGMIKGSLYKGTLTSAQKTNSGNLNFGGISGSASNASIFACKNEGELSVKANEGIVGGIVGTVHVGGYAVISTISDCYNTGTISGGNWAGGIAGYVSATYNGTEGSALAEVSRSYSSGIVKSGKNSSAAIGLVTKTGNNATARVEDCYYTSSATAADSYAEAKTLDEIFELLKGNASELWTKDSEGNLVLYWELCDYSAVDAALAKIPEDLSIYTEVSVAVLTTAKDDVVRNLSRDNQETVDEYAKAILNAISNLVKRDADYSKVESALEKIPSDLSLYTDQSVAALNSAKNAVVRGKDITDQEIVDGYATAIEDAIARLEKKTSEKTQPETENPGLGDNSFTTVFALALSLVAGYVLLLSIKRKKYMK